MKQSTTLLLFLLSSIIGLAQGFTVKDYYVDVYLNKNGYFDVVEKYDVNFYASKHGIIRDIQTNYDFYNEDGSHEKRTIYISNVKVPKHKFKKSANWQLQFDKNFQIKIGKEGKLVEGDQHYEIRYRVKNALIFNEDQVQFYWNIKPSNWQANFENVEFTIHAPDGAELSSENTFVYAGRSGNESETNDFNLDFSNQLFTAKSKEGVEYDLGQSVTVLIKMPKSLIKEVDYSPSALDKYGWLGILLLPLFFFYRLWLKHGKDDKVVPLTSYYPPKGVDSAMAGYLINDKSDANDLISLIPKWGAEGLIKVEEVEKKGWLGKPDTRLIKLKSLPEEATSYEKTIFDGLFTAKADQYIDVNQLFGSLKDRFLGKMTQEEMTEKIKEDLKSNPDIEPELESVLISELKDVFHTKMTLAKKELANEAQEFYVQKSNKIMRTAQISFGIMAFIVSAILFFFYGPVALIASIAVFGFLIAMSFYLRKKNEKGNQAYSELLGFRQFIKLAETNRIKTLIETDPDYFEKTMSYALTFGLLKQWAGKFQSLDVKPPDWYSTTSPSGVVGMNSFANSFSNSMTSAQTAMVSTPSSSSSGGGGSSGGGFGGGGGGSW